MNHNITCDRCHAVYAVGMHEDDEPCRCLGGLCFDCQLEDEAKDLANHD